VLAAEHLTHLEGADALVDGIGLGDGLGERVGVALERELETNAGIVELAALALPAVERRGQLRAFALDLLGALVVVPKLGATDLLVERAETSFRTRDVKDAPAAPRADARGPPADPSPRWS
jgi:hypothetical protein